MKIRTRLLLFLLPTLIGGIALVSVLLAYSWHQEIIEGFRTRLKSAVVSTAALIDPHDWTEDSFQTKTLSKELKQIQKELEISNLYLVPLDSVALPSIPKDVLITPVYSSPTGKEKLMTGYAPIFDAQGHVMGLIAADINVNLLDQKFKESFLLVLFSAGFTIIIMVATLYVIANKISRPVQRLNNSALAIAAGQYGESIQVKGPKEIAELANTLNTMSECLYENINRLKENSLLRERMYGEYECAMLLQHMMLQKNIDDCRSDAVAVKSLTFFSENPRGLLLDFPKTEKADLFQMHLAEAEELGFEGMYQLLTQYKLSKQSANHTVLTLDRAQNILHSRGSHQPLCWSLDAKRFLSFTDGNCKIDSGDFFFLFNQGLVQFYKKKERIEELLSKVLKIFASEGLESSAIMLQKELAFATKRKELEEDIHLLCFQIL